MRPTALTRMALFGAVVLTAMSMPVQASSDPTRSPNFTASSLNGKIIVSCAVACSVAIDGRRVGFIAENSMKEFPVEPGPRLVRIEAGRDTNDFTEVTIDVWDWGGSYHSPNVPTPDTSSKSVDHTKPAGNSGEAVSGGAAAPKHIHLEPNEGYCCNSKNCFVNHVEPNEVLGCTELGPNLIHLEPNQAYCCNSTKCFVSHVEPNEVLGCTESGPKRIHLEPNQGYCCNSKGCFVNHVEPNEVLGCTELGPNLIHLEPNQGYCSNSAKCFVGHIEPNEVLGCLTPFGSPNATPLRTRDDD
jgi:hypothetical protein